MLKILGHFILVLFIFFSCEKETNEIVTWQPEKPQNGDVITITYKPQEEQSNLGTADSIIFIGEFYSEVNDSVIIQPMKPSKKSWKVNITVPTQAYLLSFKFEDNLNRTDDNNGRGWAVMIYNQDNNVLQNTHYQLGQIYLGDIRPEAFPYFKKAAEEFAAEIAAFPKNYKSWMGLWQTQLQLAENYKPIIIRQLDSLLLIAPNDIELLKTAFYTHWRLLNNKSAALKFSNSICTESKNNDEIIYSVIHIKFSDNAQKQAEELEKFIINFPNSRFCKSVYFRLGNYYREQRNSTKAKYMFEKLNEVNPEEISYILTLTSMEIDEKNYNRARDLLTSAEERCNVDFNRKNNPWGHPGKRMNQINFNLCQIYSTKASSNHVIGEYEKEIENRKAVIELGTPFPAYEWKGIGNAYLSLGDTRRAEKAFIKSLCIIQHQNDVLASLRKIHEHFKNEITNFDSYLEAAIKDELKTSAEIAPDFVAFDLNDDKIRLTDMRGRIVVINFWDGWSPTCTREIPLLNELVSSFAAINSIEFWAISDDHKAVVKNFSEEHQFLYHQFFDGANIRKTFKIIGFPTHLIIDSRGYIRYKYVGYTPDIDQKLKDNIHYLLKENNMIL